MDILPFHRKTGATVNVDAIVHNLNIIQETIGAASVCAVIKANAYGHGDVEVAKKLEQCGIPWLAVALVEEGIRLRKNGVKSPILVLGGALGNDYDTLIEHQLTPTIFSLEHLKELHLAAGDQDKAFHLKIDTGMARLGLRTHELPEFLEQLTHYTNLRLEGVLTHLANADNRDHERNQTQLEAFNAALAIIEEAGLSPKWRHVTNSAGTLTLPDPEGNLVRVGLALYGLDPVTPRTDARLIPAMSWQTSVIHIKTIQPGDRVSYGGQWTAPEQSRIATLPVGYADGYPRSLATRAEVLIRGQRAPIVGNICMDLCMVDITGVADAKMGDEVVLLGAQGDEIISAYELASWAETIPYEITTGISYRVPRCYLSGEEG